MSEIQDLPESTPLSMIGTDMATGTSITAVGTVGVQTGVTGMAEALGIATRIDHTGSNIDLSRVQCFNQR